MRHFLLDPIFSVFKCLAFSSEACISFDYFLPSGLVLFSSRKLLFLQSSYFFLPFFFSLFFVGSEWIHSEFLSSAQSSLSSRVCHCGGMLPAHAVATVLRYWYHGSPPGEIISLGVPTEGKSTFASHILL